jgi:4'-phosphopantetheinyl transferase
MAQPPDLVPQLGKRACQVWWVDLTAARPCLDELLDTDERDRAARFRRPDDRVRFVLGAAMLRVVLASHVNASPAEVRVTRACAACGAPHGRPRLAAPGGTAIELSVTHAGDRVAIAVSRQGPVGVDVERIQPDLPVWGLAPHVLAGEELATLYGLDAARRPHGFLVYWTRKEAVLKALGVGLTVPLTSVLVSGPEEPPSLRAWPAELPLDEPLTLHDLDAGTSHVASLAIADHQASVTGLDGTPLLLRWCDTQRPRPLPAPA